MRAQRTHFSVFFYLESHLFAKWLLQKMRCFSEYARTQGLGTFLRNGLHTDITCLFCNAQGLKTGWPHISILNRTLLWFSFISKLQKGGKSILKNTTFLFHVLNGTCFCWRGGLSKSTRLRKFGAPPVCLFKQIRHSSSRPYPNPPQCIRPRCPKSNRILPHTSAQSKKRVGVLRKSNYLMVLIPEPL